MKHNEKHVQTIENAGFTQIIDYWHGVKMCSKCQEKTRFILDIVNGGKTVVYECRVCKHTVSITP